jgi:Ca2+-binding EF-hand superfamily protein
MQRPPPLATSGVDDDADIAAIVQALQEKIRLKSSGDGNIVRTIIKELKRADLNDDGTISPWELQNVLYRHFALELTDGQTDQLFRFLNTSGSGRITMPEFVQALSGQGRKIHSEGDNTENSTNEIFEKGSMFAKVIAERPPKPNLREQAVRVPPVTPVTQDAVVNKIIKDIGQKYLSRCRYDGEVVRKLNGAMRLWDRDDSGCIDEEEVGEAILDIFGYQLTPRQRHLVFQKLDQDRDGYVSKLEFIHGLTANELGRKFGNPDEFQGTDVVFKQGDAPMFNWQVRGSAEDSDLMSRRISERDFKQKVAKTQKRAIKRQQITQRPYTQNPSKLLEIIKEKIASRCTMDKNILRDVVWRLKQADESGDGNISENEMQHYVAKFFGFHLSAEQSISLFRMLDETGNGVLTREEFIRGLSGTRGAQSPWSGQKVKRSGMYAKLASTSNIGATNDPNAAKTNKDFPKLECSVPAKNMIEQMRAMVMSRCHKDSKLALYVTHIMRNYDDDNDNAIDVRELQAMLREEFRYNLTIGQASELLDAMGTPGGGSLTKDQLVHALTNKTGHVVTYVDKEGQVVSTNTLGAETHAFSKADEDAPRSVYPYARQATSPSRIDMRARTASGKKRMLKQMREKVEMLCGSDNEMCLFVTRLVRNYDTGGKGQLSITDLGCALHEQFGFDLALHEVVGVYAELNYGAGENEPLTVERFIANLIEKKGYDHTHTRNPDASSQHMRGNDHYDYYEDDKPGRDDFDPDDGYIGEGEYADDQGEGDGLEQQQQQLQQQQQELEERQFQLEMQQRELAMQKQQQMQQGAEEEREEEGGEERGEDEREEDEQMAGRVIQYPHHQHFHQQKQQLQPQKPQRPSTGRASGYQGRGNNNNAMVAARPNTGQFRTTRPATGGGGGGGGGRISGGRTLISKGQRIRRPNTATQNQNSNRPTTYDKQFQRPSSGSTNYTRPPSRHSARPNSNTCIRIGIPNIDFNSGARAMSGTGNSVQTYQQRLPSATRDQQPQSGAWGRGPQPIRMGRQGQSGQRQPIRNRMPRPNKPKQGFQGIQGVAAGVMNKRGESAPANFAYQYRLRRY